MKKLCFIIGFLILNVIITLWLINYFVWSHQIRVESGKTVQEDLVLNDGTIVLDFGSTVQGKIQLTDGSITVGENAQIYGNMVLKKGTMRKHSSGTISGLKPALYVTTNWPAALAFF